MPFVLVLLLFSLVFSGCAHKPTATDPAGDNVSAAQEAAEEKAIQKLPGGKSGSESDIGQIPVEVNAEVEKWISYFQGRGRGYFERYLERSTRYVPLMKKILKEQGVPEDLIYIAMIESGFSGKIKSRARAVGFWQFMHGTGKHYGLRVNSLMDERYDPVRSTEAAANYFKGLYNLFGNWFLAIASYNVGENRIKTLVMKNYTRDFWDLARRKQLPAETTQYIPKFIAASLISREPDKYGFTGLDYDQPLVFETVTSKDPVDLRLLAKALRIEYKDLKDLNPALKTQYAPIVGDLATIRVPQGMGDAAKIAVGEAAVKNKRLVASVEPPTKAGFLHYKVRKGETLEKIAKRFDVSVDEILKVNRLRRSRIKAGTTLKIPSSAYNIFKDGKSVTGTGRHPESILYVVKRGDTLSRIAKRHKVSLSTLAKENKLHANYKVLHGQKIFIPVIDKKSLKRKKLAEI